jgi:hypothetical protein
MTQREKHRNLLVELKNYQLIDHNVKFEDVSENPMWYMEYTTTPEKENVFINHCVLRMKDVLKISKEEAEIEASWFILQCGLPVVTGDKMDIHKGKNTTESRRIL